MTKLTFIAGGSKGLGAALVSQFQTENHEVYEFSRSGQDSHHIDCDFNQPEKAHKIFNNIFQSHVLRHVDQINLIINTAVLAPFGPISNAENAEINAHLAINIDSTVYLLKSFMASFQATKAKKTIAYISSGAALRAIPGLAIYSASKAFFERLVNTLAEEQNAESSPFNCMVINPGIMNTDMQAEIRAQKAEDFPLVTMWNDFHTKGQLADPIDVATVCKKLVINSGINGGYYSAQELMDKPQN